MVGRVGPRVALISAALAVAAGTIGLIGSLILGAFVFDDFDAHGEVPIPGSGRLHLPAGEVTISFHTLVTGGTDGGFPIPPLEIGITAPDGVRDPVLTESMGSTTSVNSDVRARVWRAQIAEDGVYDIETGGDVNGYITPRLAFGADTTPGWLLWASGALVLAGIVGIAVAVTWRDRIAKAARPLPGPVVLDEPRWPGPLPPPVTAHHPAHQSVRLEQLKTLAALRDSGALTDAEFEAEKRRVLGG